jgi:hypothetical protein
MYRLVTAYPTFSVVDTCVPLEVVGCVVRGIDSILIVRCKLKGSQQEVV